MLNKQIDEILSSDEGTSFSIAFLLHAIILIFLALIFSIPDVIRPSLIITSSIVDAESIVEESPVEIEQVNFSDDTSFEVSDIVQQTPDSSLKIDDIEPPSNIEIVSDVGFGEFSSDLISDHISGVSDSAGGGISIQSSSGGALDRLTLEIIRNSETKNLTVVWLFDASISLSHQRQQIHDRFDKILVELDLAHHNKSIVHSVCSFGKDIRFITENPNDNAEVLKKNISSITLDESGVENTFGAVIKVCQKYASSSRLMVVVFTDEVGEDITLLDDAIHLARSKGSMIYVVGSPSPFGKSTTQFKFVEFDPKYESAERWVEIQQGPETLYDLTLNLHSLPIDDETLDSGFGPFALSKLCYDTGGLFFSVHPNRNNQKNYKHTISPLSSYISRFFDSEVMREYRPDYRPVVAQNKDNNHITKQALIRACSIPVNITGEQTLRFKAFNEGMFSEELSMAQRFSARLEPKINEVYMILSVGEPAHSTLKDKRWMASYSLAMGRILATKCRIESYNLVLAEAKSGLKKKDPKTNIWILRHSNEFASSNSVLRKNYEASQKYLKYVIEHFPNTPWALIAQEELDTPVGYVWVEDYQEPPKPRDGGGGNNRQDDKMKPKLIPKPSRKIDKI